GRRRFSWPVSIGNGTDRSRFGHHRALLDGNVVWPDTATARRHHELDRRPGGRLALVDFLHLHHQRLAWRHVKLEPFRRASFPFVLADRLAIAKSCEKRFLHPLGGASPPGGIPCHCVAWGGGMEKMNANWNDE